MNIKVYGNCMTFLWITNDNDIFQRIDNVNYTFERFAKHMQVPTFALNKGTVARLVLSVVVKLCHTLCTDTIKHTGKI